MTTHDHRRTLAIVDSTRKSVRAWQNQIRNPSLTVLLVLELCAIFLAAPLAAKRMPVARVVTDTLVLGVLVIVVMLSHRWDAIILILAGLAAIAASILLNKEWSPVSSIVLRCGGDVLAFFCADLSSSTGGLFTWPYYISPASRRERTLSEPCDDLRLGLRPDLGK